jgi:hypothetical protein
MKTPFIDRSAVSFGAICVLPPFQSFGEDTLTLELLNVHIGTFLNGACENNVGEI